MDAISIGYSSRFRGLASARGRLACQWVLGLSLAIVCQTAFAQAMYRMKPLGYLGDCYYDVGVAGLDEADQAVGTACNKHGDPHAFLWTNNGNPRVDLGPAEVGSFSFASAINASGLVAGRAGDGTGEYGFVSSGNGAPMKKIPNSLGGANSHARAVNDSGQVTGGAENVPGHITTNAFLWKADGKPMRDLGDSGYFTSWGKAINASGQVAVYANDGDRTGAVFIWKNDGSPLFSLGTLGGNTDACCINASGQIAGRSSVSGYTHFHAFLWSNDGTKMRDLGTLASGTLSEAHALNDSGQVAGWSNIGGWNSSVHAFVWMNDGTSMKDLGTLGGTRSLASDINASGQVTGYAYLAGDTIAHAFLWRNDGTKKQDVNTLIDPRDPLKPYVTLTDGLFINNRGNILAMGTDSRTRKSSPYLLQGTILTLTPRSLAFGSQRISTTSAAKSVTVTNTSSKVVAVTSIALTGSAPGQFASTNNCGKSLAGYATCTIKVTFKPTSKGAKSALLNVNGGGGGLRSVTLTGNGT